MKIIKKQYRFILFLMFLLIVMISCSLENYTTRKNNADQEVLSYLIENKIDIKPNHSGLVYIPIENGQGDLPQLGDKVAFHYTGSYFSGEVFDSSYGKPYPLIIELGKGMIIKGLEEALLLMRKGDKAKVIVPFYLAYDDMENAPVPPYSNLIFELEMLDFTKVTQ